jgi:hypothetical protein
MPRSTPGRVGPNPRTSGTPVTDARVPEPHEFVPRGVLAEFGPSLADS